jgi:phosphate transport system protein
MTSGVPLRQGFTAELEQLRLQVEVMAVRVDQNLERTREVLHTGDLRLAERAVDADDDIDAMNVSLTERCYDLLRREAPVASDLRFVVSVLRVLGELERVGDLALRVIKLAPDQPLLALRAWATMDLDLATELASASSSMDLCFERLMVEILRLDGPDAVRLGVQTFTAGRSLERIADHAGVIGARLRYLITGDPDHLVAEVR